MLYFFQKNKPKKQHFHSSLYLSIIINQILFSMKKYLLLFALSFPFILTGQLTSDDFESYSVGDFDSQWTVGEWVGWFNAPSGTSISEAYANSGTKSVEVEQDDDLIALLGTIDQGAHRITYWQYVPSGNAGYTNLQHAYTSTAGDWMVEMYVKADGTGQFNSNGFGFAFTPIYDQWVEYRFDLNFITSDATFYYDGVPLFNFLINTNAAGGAGLNEVNAINFYGGCLASQAGCTPLAYYDDVSVEVLPIPAHNARVLNPVPPTEYTSVPPGLEQPITLSADVWNIGTESITDVTVTFNLKDSGGNTIHTETSDPTASIGSGEQFTISATTNYTMSGIDNYSMEYVVNIAETDGDMNDNTTSIDVPYIADPNIYSRDDGMYVDGVGVNGGTALLGQTFEFIDQATVSSIALFFIGGAVGDTINGYIYAVDGTGVPTGVIATTEPFEITEVGGIGNDIFTNLTFTDEVELAPGDYVFMVEQTTTTSLAVSVSTSVFTPDRTWASTDDGATWGNLEDFNLPISFGIRPVVTMVGVNTDESASNYVNELSISPNPTTDFVTINLQLLEVKDLEVNVFNINGQLLESFRDKNTLGGQYELDLEEYASGVYFVKFKIDDQTITRKVILH